MQMKTISKLLASSIFAFSASASLAAPVTEWEILANMTWDTNTYKFVPGDETYNPTQYGYTVTESKVIWGYTGYDKKGNPVKNKPVDYTNPYSNDNYTTSALVIEQNSGKKQLSANGAGTTTNTITFWNNFLDEDFVVPQSLVLNMTLDLSPLGGSSVFSIADSLQVYYERYNVRYDKHGNIKDIDHGTGYVIIPGDLAYSFSYDGYDYTLSFDIAGYTLTNQCGNSGFATCYLVGDDVKKGKPNMSTINFNATISAVQSPIPEPETYAMLLAGLGLVGMASRRRRNAIRN